MKSQATAENKRYEQQANGFSKNIAQDKNADGDVEALYKSLKSMKNFDNNFEGDDDEIVMDKNEEEEFLEELATWGKSPEHPIKKKHDGRGVVKEDLSTSADILDTLLNEANEAVQGLY